MESINTKQEEIKAKEVSQDISSKIQLYEDKSTKAMIYMMKKVNIESRVEYVELEIERAPFGKLTKMYKPSEINQKNLSKINDYGYSMDEWQVSELISDINSARNTLRTSYFHEGIGWLNIEDTKVFRADNLLSKDINIKSKYKGKEFNLAPKGSLEEWIKGVRENVTGHKILELVLAAGFTAPLIGIINGYHAIESIIINLSGTSSIGKTTAIRLALSPWGNINSTKGSLVKRWNGTDKAIVKILEGNVGIPVAIDDTSLSEKRDFTKMIYQLASGESYSALKQNGDIRETHQWETILLSSSEVSILDTLDKKKLGAQARLLEIDCEEGTLTKDVQHSDNITDFILKNHGHAGEVFIESILNEGFDKIYARYRQIKALFESKINTHIQNTNKKFNSGLANRSVGKLALIYLAGQLVNETFRLDFDIESLQETLLNIDENCYSDTPMHEKALKAFLEYFSINQSKFASNNKEVRSRTLGLYEIDESGIISKIKIPSMNFSNIIEELGYDRLQVLKKWKAENIIEVDKGRNDKKFGFGIADPRGIVICINKYLDEL